jgi:hypothetical protein
MSAYPWAPLGCRPDPTSRELREVPCTATKRGGDFPLWLSSKRRSWLRARDLGGTGWVTAAGCCWRQKLLLHEQGIDPCQAKKAARSEQWSRQSDTPWGRRRRTDKGPGRRAPGAGVTARTWPRSARTASCRPLAACRLRRSPLRLSGGTANAACSTATISRPMPSSGIPRSSRSPATSRASAEESYRNCSQRCGPTRSTSTPAPCRRWGC